jgi:hypothetical protein
MASDAMMRAGAWWLRDVVNHVCDGEGDDDACVMAREMMMRVANAREMMMRV